MELLLPLRGSKVIIWLNCFFLFESHNMTCKIVSCEDKVCTVPSLLLHAFLHLFFGLPSSPFCGLFERGLLERGLYICIFPHSISLWYKRLAPCLDSYSPCFQWSAAVLWIKAVHIQWWVISLSLATREVKVLRKGHGSAWKSTLSFLRLNRKAGMVVEQASALLSNYLSNCCSSAKPWGVRTSKVILDNYISVLLWYLCFSKLWP